MNFSASLIWPALALGLLGWAVPKGFARVLAEGVKPLMFNAFLSTLFLYGLSALLFFFLYLMRGAPLEELAGAGTLANVVYFGRLGLMASLIWLPIMILTLANLPKHWKTEVW